MSDMSDKHDKARDLAEKALDKLVEGNEGEADALIEKSKRIDPSAAADLVKDLDEDAATRGESSGAASGGTARAKKS
jgi:hypothetical protein